MSDPLVIENLRLALDDRSLLSLDCAVAPAEVLTVMGPSGSGKSTLLSWMTGHLTLPFKATGALRLGDRTLSDMPPNRRQLGILFQDDLLFPHMSVGQNIAFGLREKDDRDSKIAQALKEVELDGYADRDPATLSGGQRARVALMRTLVASPRALLLDEPFSRLDRDLRQSVRSMVFERARSRGLPVVLVTHDHEDAQAANGPVVTLGQSGH